MGLIDSLDVQTLYHYKPLLDLGNETNFNWGFFVNSMCIPVEVFICYIKPNNVMIKISVTWFKETSVDKNVR